MKRAAEDMARSIILRRMSGLPIGKIAKEINSTRQTCWNYVDSLTKQATDSGAPPVSFVTMSPSDKAKLTDLIVRSEGDIEEIQKGLGKSGLSANDILWTIRQKRPILKETLLSPALDEWRKERQLSIIELGQLAGLPKTSMGYILRLRFHLRLATAQNIKTFTGIPLRKLYHAYIEEIDKEIDRRYNGGKNMKPAPAQNSEPQPPQAQVKPEKAPAPASNVRAAKEKLVFPPQKRRKKHEAQTNA